MYILTKFYVLKVSYFFIFIKNDFENRSENNSKSACSVLVSFLAFIQMRFEFYSIF